MRNISHHLFEGMVFLFILCSYGTCFLQKRVYLIDKFFLGTSLRMKKHISILVANIAHLYDDTPELFHMNKAEEQKYAHSRCEYYS